MTKYVSENLVTVERLPSGEVKIEKHENNLEGRVTFEHTFKPHEFGALRALFGEPIADSLAAVEPAIEFSGGPLVIGDGELKVEPVIAEAVGVAVGRGNRPKTEAASEAVVEPRIAEAAGSAGGKGSA